MVRRKPDYEEDPDAFPAETYECSHWPGVAIRVLGWDIVEDGYDHFERTGNVTVRMVGDDKHWYVEPASLTVLPEDEYCAECGQIGCTASKGV